jgi:hypothetical protein
MKSWNVGPSAILIHKVRKRLEKKGEYMYNTCVRVERYEITRSLETFTLLLHHKVHYMRCSILLIYTEGKAICDGDCRRQSQYSIPGQ